VKYQFIAAHREQFEITVMCRVLTVSRSGYYAWLKRPTSSREMADQALSQQIKEIHQQSRQTYGSPRIQAELAENGVNCGHKRVARLMRDEELFAKQSRKFRVTTTDSAHSYPVAPNLLDQAFRASRANEKWLTDITYIPTAEGWLYLAVVLDLYSRRIVGWAMSDSLERHLVIAALQMAIKMRQPSPGLLHHSDRGSQYASEDYQALLTQHQMRCSMSRTGNCYDNAPTESFFGTLKTELVHHCQYQTKAEAKTDIFEYIEVFYNRFRRHSALGYQSPVNFEKLDLCFKSF
jgi:transposase InsO family protein